jgi:LCP family protein required for cell wall assembly
MGSWHDDPPTAPFRRPDASDLLLSDKSPDDPGAPTPSPRERRRGRRILIGLAVVVLLLLGAAGATTFVLTERLGNNVTRLPDAFQGLDAQARPPVNDAVTFLLVGTDSRSDEPTTGADAPLGVDPGSQRSDVLMLARINPARTAASVVSIPRDSWVDIPGRGFNKINAAYAFGGPPLLITTVEKLTNIRIDHFAVIDFAGFQAMVDTVGGIDVNVAKATSHDGVQFRQGANHLDGVQALAYVRQRYELPRGDIDRAQRQQNALRALLDKAASSGVLADPVKLYRLLDAVSRSVSIDDTLSNGGIRGLGIEMSGLRPSGVTFLGAPVRGLGREGAQSVVYLDDARAAELWDALTSDALEAYAQRNRADSLSDSPP